jgi:hypothetical protein
MAAAPAECGLSSTATASAGGWPPSSLAEHRVQPEELLLVAGAARIDRLGATFNSDKG